MYSSLEKLLYMLFRTCSKFAAYLYQKKCFEFFLHSVHLLLATSFVVFVLKEKRKMALLVICAFIKLESIFDCFRTLLHRIASNYLKVTTKKALWVIRTCNKLEGFCYQKQCFGLFLHLVHCCVGIVGVNSITFSKNTLLATSVVVPPMLKEPTKKALWVITTCNKLKGFWYQKQCFGLIFASCTLRHGTNWCKIHHI